MKPREFDDLVRQKFDKGHFEYNPGNWSRLEEQLEGQTKKKSVAIWWLPLMAIAAAVTVSMGFATYMKQAEPIWNEHKTSALAKEHTKHHDISRPAAIPTHEEVNPEADSGNEGKVGNTTAPTARNDELLNYAEACSPKIDPSYLMTGSGFKKSAKQLLAGAKSLQPPVSLYDEKKARKNKAEPEIQMVYRTFADEPETHKRLGQVSLSGGLNMGNRNSGFTLGATGRKMVSDRVFVEGDIAITGSNNTQKTAYLNEANIYASAKMSNSGTRTTSGDGTLTGAAGSQAGSILVADRSFNMYYAQITPAIGYQLAKRFSLGAGPDFQQALSDTRPTPSTMDRNNVQVTPMFDIGVIGKAELMLNDRFRAALTYREGINNIITPMDKYVERSYMQVQIKYTVFRNF